ncbi:hypothetical protein AOLI_G00097600 [Acnodon oligacanthus]
MNRTDKRGAARKPDNTAAAGTEAMRHEAAFLAERDFNPAVDLPTRSRCTNDGGQHLPVKAEGSRYFHCDLQMYYFCPLKPPIYSLWSDGNP